MGGHIGERALQDKLAKRFYWEGMSTHCRQHVAFCKECQFAKTSKLSRAEEVLHPIPIPMGKVWYQVGIDLMGPLPETEHGYKFILTCICYFSKMVELYPLRRKHSMEVSAALYQLTTRHGCPAIIISDQGREFVNDLSRRLYKLTRTTHRITSAYHPQVCNFSPRRCLVQSSSRVNNENICYLFRQMDWWSVKTEPLRA